MITHAIAASDSNPLIIIKVSRPKLYECESLSKLSVNESQTIDKVSWRKINV